MEYALIVSWIYFGVYMLIFFITSIICGVSVKDEYKNDKKQKENNNNNNKVDIEQTESTQQQDIENKLENKDIKKKEHGFKYYVKKWAKLVWQKKKIYLQIIPHLFDQATDVGVMLQYYQYRNDSDIKEQINTLYLFYTSIIVLILHRIISSFGIWQLTRNWVNVCLQTLDLLMIRAVWTSYKIGSDEPSTAQRYLGIMEAVFEAMPQLLMSTGFIVKTGKVDSIIIISLVSSLWSLTARVSGDDKMYLVSEWRSLEFTYKQCPFINWRYVHRLFWRFLEISSRLCFLTILWINLGGFATFIIIGIDALFCIILCIAYKTIGNMGNMMYIARDTGVGQNECAEILYFIFLAYRGLTGYCLLITATIFATINFNSWKIDDYESRNNNTVKQPLGLFVLIYCWIANCVWPWLAGWLVFNNAFGRNDEMSTSRDIEELYRYGNYTDIIELIEFGKQNLSDKDIKFLDKIASGDAAYKEEAPDANIMAKAAQLKIRLNESQK